MPGSTPLPAAESTGDLPADPAPTPPAVPDLVALLRNAADALEATQEVTPNAAAQ